MATAALPAQDAALVLALPAADSLAPIDPGKTNLRVNGKVYRRKIGNANSQELVDSIWNGKRWLCLHVRQRGKCTTTGCPHSACCAVRVRKTKRNHDQAGDTSGCPHSGTSDVHVRERSHDQAGDTTPKSCAAATPTKKLRGCGRLYTTFHRCPISSDKDADQCLDHCLKTELKDTFAHLRPGTSKSTRTKSSGKGHLFYRCSCIGFMEKCEKRVRIERFKDHWNLSTSGKHCHSVEMCTTSVEGLKQYPFVDEAVTEILHDQRGHVPLSFGQSCCCRTYYRAECFDSRMQCNAPSEYPVTNALA